MRHEKKLAKALLTLFIDEEQEKLYDKYKAIKLSHNRKYLLLKEIYRKLEFVKNNYPSESLRMELHELMKKISSEINFIGRKNWGVK